MPGSMPVMARSVALAVAVMLAAGLPRASAAQRAEMPEASAGIAIFDVRRPAGNVVVRPVVRRDPRYYARPVHYRPYPYGVPAPFVFGYGPFW